MAEVTAKPPQRALCDRMAKSLEGLLESYDIMMETLPAGAPRGAIAGLFHGEESEAREAVKDYREAMQAA